VATVRHRKPENFLAAVDAQAHGLAEQRALGMAEQASEAMLMGLRLAEGVDVKALAARFGFAESDLVVPAKRAFYRIGPAERYRRPAGRDRKGHAAARCAAGRTRARKPGRGMTPQDILEAWGQHLSLARRRSPHTVRAYLATATRLLAALPPAQGWASLARLDPATLRTHLAARRADGIGNVSAARELSAIKSFIAFAREQSGETGIAPPRLRGPRVKKACRARSRRTRRSTSPPWSPKTPARNGSPRDRAVLLLLYGAGLRIAEALALPAAVLPLGESLVVTGKGNRQRVVAILPIVRAAVEDYAAKVPWPLAKDAPCSAAPRAVRWRRAWCRGRRARPHGAGPPPPPRRTPCATASPRTCWARARTCVRCRSCWATPASVPRRSTPRWTLQRCWTSIATPIRANARRPCYHHARQAQRGQHPPRSSLSFSAIEPP
jgi:integrase/recombinase XerC